MAIDSHLARLGHVMLRTPDIEKSLWFFDTVAGLNVVERTEDTAYLRGWGDFEHHTLALRTHETGGLDHVGWRTRSSDDLHALVGRLRSAGVELTPVAAGEERGQGEAFRFRTPTGFPYEIYFDVEKPDLRERALPTNSGCVWDHGISPRRIDHVNFVTPDPATERSWAEGSLGFRTHEFVTDTDGSTRAAWLSVTPLAHDLAVGRAANGKPGLHHVAFALDNASDVLRAAEIYAEHGLQPDHGPGRHAISQAVCIYTRDPASGVRLELYSSAYLVLDPDWEPVEWTVDTYRQWWGPEPIRGENAPLDVVAPC